MAVRKKTWIGLAAIVVVVVGAVALIWFQPQKLFYDQRVDEALPSAAGQSAPVGTGGGPAEGTATPAAPAVLAVGSFISREHETTGTARVLELPDGQVVVRLEGFATSNGPALFVYLSANPAHGEDGLFDDDYVDLGPLKGNVGDQNYVVPAGVDATDWTSVVIWCDRFSVSFGAADLQPRPDP
ncbi:MAG TPA: DM13 domain-containing protein [Geodermatophilus sp.]|nr:DM13 domain-containing protein [Geodermatophilus sp.]